MTVLNDDEEDRKVSVITKAVAVAEDQDLATIPDDRITVGLTRVSVPGITVVGV